MSIMSLHTQDLTVVFKVAPVVKITLILTIHLFIFICCVISWMLAYPSIEFQTFFGTFSSLIVCNLLESLLFFCSCSFWPQCLWKEACWTVINDCQNHWMILCFKHNCFLLSCQYIKIPAAAPRPSSALGLFTFYLSGDGRDQPQASFDCIHQYVSR